MTVCYRLDTVPVGQPRTSKHRIAFSFVCLIKGEAKSPLPMLTLEMTDVLCEIGMQLQKKKSKLKLLTRKFSIRNL